MRCKKNSNGSDEMECIKGMNGMNGMKRMKKYKTIN